VGKGVLKFIINVSCVVWCNSDWQQEVIISATVFGAMISSLASGPLCDYFGRRMMVLIAAVVFVAGAFIMALAPDYVVLTVGRFVIGLGVGSASMNMPIIISEMAEASVRGMLVTCINVAITFGQFAACVVAGMLSSSESGWRYMLGLAAVPAVIQFIGFLFMPESPRYLVQCDQVEEATAVLQRIRGRIDVYNELDEIVSAVAKDRADRRECESAYASERVGEKDKQRSFMSEMSVAATRRALLLGCLLQCAQQIGGINTIM
jgi:SP family myo-inositol transporter-like MFS transporter 13